MASRLGPPRKGIDIAPTIDIIWVRIISMLPLKPPSRTSAGSVCPLRTTPTKNT